MKPVRVTITGAAVSGTETVVPVAEEAEAVTAAGDRRDIRVS
jgi:hypothetical protein